MSVRSAPCFSRVCLRGPGRSGGGRLFGAHAPAQTRSHAVWTVLTCKSKIRPSHQIHLLCAAGGEWPGNATNPSNGCLRNVSRRARHYPFDLLGFLLARHSAWPTEYVNVPEACRAFCEHKAPACFTERVIGAAGRTASPSHGRPSSSKRCCSGTLCFGWVLEHFVFSAQGRQSSR